MRWNDPPSCNTNDLSTTSWHSKTPLILTHTHTVTLEMKSLANVPCSGQLIEIYIHFERKPWGFNFELVCKHLLKYLVIKTSINICLWIKKEKSASMPTFNKILIIHCVIILCTTLINANFTFQWKPEIMLLRTRYKIPFYTYFILAPPYFTDNFSSLMLLIVLPANTIASFQIDHFWRWWICTVPHKTTPDFLAGKSNNSMHIRWESMTHAMHNRV